MFGYTAKLGVFSSFCYIYSAYLYKHQPVIYSSFQNMHIMVKQICHIYMPVGCEKEIKMNTFKSPRVSMAFVVRL